MKGVFQLPFSASEAFPVRLSMRVMVCALVILLSRSNTGVPSEFTPVPEKSHIEYKDQADWICSFVAAKTGEAHITDAAIIIEVSRLKFFINIISFFRILP